MLTHLLFWLGYPHSRLPPLFKSVAILNTEQHLGKQATHSNSCDIWHRREEESRDNSAEQSSSKSWPSIICKPNNRWGLHARRTFQQACLSLDIPRKYRHSESESNHEHTNYQSISASRTFSQDLSNQNYLCANPESSPIILRFAK